MAYTFGAGNGDYVSISTTTPNSFTTGVGFFSLWFYPTTLTSGRTLFSLPATSNPASLRVDATTSQLRWLSGSQTTNGEFTTSGTTITTNRWWFVAIACNQVLNTSGLRIWIGNETQPPIEQTLTQAVAPSSDTGTNSLSIVIGNRTTGSSSAFQGDIGHFFFMNAQTAISPLHFSTANTIDAAESTGLQRNIVFPIWTGRFNIGSVLPIPNYTTTNHHMLTVPMRGPFWTRIQRQGLTTTPAITISGATLTQNREPTTITPTLRYGTRRLLALR